MSEAVNVLQKLHISLPNVPSTIPLSPTRRQSTSPFFGRQLNMRDPGSRSPTSQRPKMLTRSFLPSEESAKTMSDKMKSSSFSLLKPAEKEGKDSGSSPGSAEYKKDDSPR